MRTRERTLAVTLALFAASLGCSKPDATLPDGHPSILADAGRTTEDTSSKQAPRLLSQEAYIRSYMLLFGGLSPLETETAARGQDSGALFGTWNDYTASLGLPEYTVDLPRMTQTNTLMLATFERMGVALCDRAVERDLRTTPNEKQVVFAFDIPAAPLDAAGFATRFDSLHRTFLGYPARLAPASRGPAFFKLYGDTVAAAGAMGAPVSRFSPPEAGWAAVCYGLVRHPEFHLY